jgi:hypothetical protein
VYEEEELELHFFNLVFKYVGENANFETYLKMDDEKRKKLIERFTIMICKAYSPRKNYDISKDDVRLMVKCSFNYWLSPVNVHED